MAEARAMVNFESVKQMGTAEYISMASAMMKGSPWKHGDGKNLTVMGITKSFLRWLKKQFFRAENALISALFPSTTFSFYASLGSVAAGYYFAPQHMPRVERLVPGLARIPAGVPRMIYTTVVGGTSFWVGSIFASRTILSCLLTYQGYLNDAPNKTSKRTMIWGLLVKLFRGFGVPRTYSYQSVLPTLPLPSLSATCQRYLESARPLLDDAEFSRMERLAADFVSNEGPSLQRWLRLKWLWAPNYVSDWWERFIYLRGRSSIMINSNYYITDAYTWTPTNKQVARAANMLYIFMGYKRSLDREQLQPLVMRGMIPLCSNQYRRTFSTVRIPQLEEDVIQHVESKHVAVLCKGNFYIFNLIDPHGQLLSPRDIEAQLTFIVNDSTKRGPSPYVVEHLPAMTAVGRDTWANFRSKFMADGVTRASLEAVERAIVFLVLDDSSPTHPADNYHSNNEVCHSLIHGNGSNRWFDKSINLVVFANGKAGLNVEHSWADAPVMGHLWEYTLATEFAGPGYDESTGLNKAVPYPHAETATPLCLRFELPEEAEAIVRASVAEAETAIADLDLVLLVFDTYSKGFIKKCKISPDAWLQMALQLAYYRDSGKFAQTYEASMTRLFKEGRTETVRSVSVQSCNFVRAMENPNASKEEKRALLNKAGDKHVNAFKDSMTGKGIDRHLFALYVMSLWKGLDCKFLKEVLSAPWVLSTSQTPAQQTELFDLTNNQGKISCGGGFGPVTDDGYGVSYLVASDNILSFHVSSKRSSSKTNSERFADNIRKALLDMRDLYS